jgi:hypothetical protein
VNYKLVDLHLAQPLNVEQWSRDLRRQVSAQLLIM